MAVPLSVAVARSVTPECTAAECSWLMQGFEACDNLSTYKMTLDPAKYLMMVQVTHRDPAESSP